jgi:hypothetical protein
MSNLYRVNLEVCENVESLPVALLLTVCRCLV